MLADGNAHLDGAQSFKLKTPLRDPAWFSVGALPEIFLKFVDRSAEASGVSVDVWGQSCSTLSWSAISWLLGILFVH